VEHRKATNKFGGMIKMKKLIEKESEYFQIDKEEWEKTLNVNKKMLLKVALAGAAVGVIVASLFWYVYIRTGFVW
jgi:hypothetical protein